MRPPRIAILVLFFSASLFLLARFISSIRRSSSGPTISTTSTNKSPFRSFFSFTAPFSLFPPNAVISLTDDNSTFFPARPAAFGPAFPTRGLSGQLWIGSGFADDNLQDGDGEGELGCSDVAGWEDGVSNRNLALKAKVLANTNDKSAAVAAGKAKTTKRDDLAPGLAVDRNVALEKAPQGHPPPPVDDGTDDYLHRGLTPAKNAQHDALIGSGTSHADIQVIQETAEITGKVVLLSRGGCGFLEKTKWAQRRGAIALIVGDNQKGGPLIQMFARGNTDNVTIPSVFTSRTTAHLLSSLVQPGNFDILDENNALQKAPQADKGRKNMDTNTKPDTTSTTVSRMATGIPKSAGKSSLSHKGSPTTGELASGKQPRGNWITRLFRWGSSDSVVSERSRPPSSGRLDWVIVDDWSVEKDKQIEKSLNKASKKVNSNGEVGMTGSHRNQGGDNFQIGVQDWRDPDLVGSSGKDSKNPPVAKDTAKSSGKKAQTGAKDAPAKESTKKSAKGAAKDVNGPKGGSITPSSGEYAPEIAKDDRSSSSRKSDAKTDSQGGIISKIFGDDDGADFTTTDAGSHAKDAHLPSAPPAREDSAPGRHEGLWVTITPTGSASPFFDTFLVLVISPLITLTVVYALLILRAKIRRRRWRAPKSVVERLPVRTYHTVASSPTHTPRLPSPTSSSPTTPLLQGSSRSRPRSRTTTGVPDSNDLLRVDTALQDSRSPSRSGVEKDISNHVSSEWKKYMGRQVECVVCLEEYIDGVSQVMSLPCGHEFHAECITPWLTTRRRTCPICKGDVVRSLARGSSSSPRYEPYHDDSDEDVEATASGALGITDRDREAILQENRLAASVPRSGRRTPPQSDGFFSAIRNGAGSGPSFRNLEDERRAREDLRRRDDDEPWP